jgi:hypothetical protein
LAAKSIETITPISTFKKKAVRFMRTALSEYQLSGGLFLLLVPRLIVSVRGTLVSLAGVLVCSLGVLMSGFMIAFFVMLGGGAV